MTTSNSSYSFLFASLAVSSAVTLLPYDLNPEYDLPTNGQYDVTKEITDWNIDSSINLRDYTLDESTEIDIMLNFSQKLASNSKNLDSEFVEIVNEYFWDLL